MTKQPSFTMWQSSLFLDCFAFGSQGRELSFLTQLRNPSWVLRSATMRRMTVQHDMER